jgi:hypothetical protein
MYLALHSAFQVIKKFSSPSFGFFSTDFLRKKARTQSNLKFQRKKEPRNEKGDVPYEKFCFHLSGRPDDLVKKSPKMSPNPFPAKLISDLYLFFLFFFFGKVGKVQKFGLPISLIVKNTAQRKKKSPNRQKFAQSGHPATNVRHKKSWQMQWYTKNKAKVDPILCRQVWRCNFSVVKSSKSNKWSCACSKNFYLP